MHRRETHSEPLRQRHVLLRLPLRIQPRRWPAAAECLKLSKAYRRIGAQRLLKREFRIAAGAGGEVGHGSHNDASLQITCRQFTDRMKTRRSACYWRRDAAKSNFTRARVYRILNPLCSRV